MGLLRYQQGYDILVYNMRPRVMIVSPNLSLSLSMTAVMFVCRSLGSSNRESCLPPGVRLEAVMPSKRTPSLRGTCCAMSQAAAKMLMSRVMADGRVTLRVIVRKDENRILTVMVLAPSPAFLSLQPNFSARANKTALISTVERISLAKVFSVPIDLASRSGMMGLLSRPHARLYSSVALFPKCCVKILISVLRKSLIVSICRFLRMPTVTLPTPQSFLTGRGPVAQFPHLGG